MADIELAIKIDEEDFKIMKHNIAVDNPLCPISQKEMVIKIANGIPLPKFESCAEQEPREGHWIPVSERLPEKDGRYLAYIVNEYDNKLLYIMTCVYMVDGYWHWFPDDECASDNVIAWMPLPKPYKAER